MKVDAYSYYQDSRDSCWYVVRIYNDYDIQVVSRGYKYMRWARWMALERAEKEGVKYIGRLSPDPSLTKMTIGVQDP